jgi:hypothetical protein
MGCPNCGVAAGVDLGDCSGGRVCNPYNECESPRPSHPRPHSTRGAACTPTSSYYF